MDEKIKKERPGETFQGRVLAGILNVFITKMVELITATDAIHASKLNARFSGLEWFMREDSQDAANFCHPNPRLCNALLMPFGFRNSSSGVRWPVGVQREREGLAYGKWRKR